MHHLKQALQIKLAAASKIVLLAVGSDLRGDDAAGLLVAERLQSKTSDKFQILIGGTAPENLTGEIKRLKPSHLLIVDAANMKVAPGTVQILSHQEIGGSSFSTHALPLKVMIDYILVDHPCEVIVITIQPQDITFDGPVSAAVKQAAELVAAAIFSAGNLGNLDGGGAAA